MQHLEPRVLDFTMSGVEVITGKSSTGKSSLIPIVDYCLGSEKCAIPVGCIRDSVEWFGVLLKLPDGEMLLARRNPGIHSGTSEMLMDIRSVISIPQSPEDFEAVNRTSVLTKLNQLAELPSLPLVEGDDAGFGGRPSFRDMAAFQFQPQHIVANPYTLFFNADTYEHQQKLKNVFPLVMGAIDPQTLELRRQATVLESELKIGKDQLEERRQRSATWLNDFRSFYTEARGFGLLPDGPDPSPDWKTENFVGYLSPIPNQIKRNPIPKVERGAARRLAREIASLQNEEDSISRAIEDRQRKLSKVERLRSSTDEYSQATSIQGSRLEPLSWFATKIQKAHNCPVCGSDSHSAATEVRRLTQLAEDLSGRIEAIGSVNQVLDREVGVLEDELRKGEDALGKIRERLAKLNQESDELRSHRQSLQNLYNFVGRLEQELTKFNEIDREGSLAKEVAAMESRLARLRREVNQASIQKRQDSAIEAIATSIHHYAEILNLEQREKRALLDIKNLTLAFHSPNGGKDFLWEIGSGANWMGYHLAVLLSLHEYFLLISDAGSSPVPQFLFVDQPSQAFFPERWKTVGTEEPELDSDDVARVQRIFKALSSAIVRTKKRLQIIVIEHVGESAWDGIPHIKVAQRWRGDEALIPKTWLVPPTKMQ